MSLTLSRCVPADAPELARVHQAAFSKAPTYSAVYHGVDPAVVISKYERGLASGLEEQDNPTAWREVHCLKVTDDDTEEIAAYVIWVFWPQGYHAEHDPQAQSTAMPEGCNLGLASALAVSTSVIRSEHKGRKEPHLLLSVLGTHPRHERRGAASKLIRWPFERADTEGLPCYVDSSITGHALYQRVGFKDVGDIKIDLDKYDGEQGFGLQRWIAMVREAAPRP